MKRCFLNLLLGSSLLVGSGLSSCSNDDDFDKSGEVDVNGTRIVTFQVSEGYEGAGVSTRAAGTTEGPTVTYQRLDNGMILAMSLEEDKQAVSRGAIGKTPIAEGTLVDAYVLNSDRSIYSTQVDLKVKTGGVLDVRVPDREVTVLLFSLGTKDSPGSTLKGSGTVLKSGVGVDVNAMCAEVTVSSAASSASVNLHSYFSQIRMKVTSSATYRSNAVRVKGFNISLNGVYGRTSANLLKDGSIDVAGADAYAGTYGFTATATTPTSQLLSGDTSNPYSHTLIQSGVSACATISNIDWITATTAGVQVDGGIITGQTVNFPAIPLSGGGKCYTLTAEIKGSSDIVAGFDGGYTMWGANEAYPIHPTMDDYTGDRYAPDEKNFVAASTSTCGKCPTIEDFKILMAQPNSCYVDADGPEWFMGYDDEVHTEGLWILKRTYWTVFTPLAAQSIEVGVADDVVRNSGRYFFVPAAGYGPTNPNVLPNGIGEMGQYWTRDRVSGRVYFFRFRVDIPLSQWTKISIESLTGTDGIRIPRTVLYF